MENKKLEYKPNKYLNKAMDEGYNIIVSSSNPWPVDFDLQTKIKSLEYFIFHFTEREEYEKCGSLNNILLKLKDGKKEK